MEASRKLPSREITLETADATFYFFKADILAGTVSYSTDKRMAANVTTISAERAFEIHNMNKKGEKPLSLVESTDEAPKGSLDLAEQESLTRFDKNKRKNNKQRGDKQRHNNGNQEQRPNNEHRNNRGERRPKKKGTGDRPN
jgi:hypothetical protein